MTAKKKLRQCVIISADDFGLVPGVNRGIEEALSRGALTSTSIMANTPGFDDAAERARRHPSWSVGIHLNVLRGRPVLPARQLRGLVKREFFKHTFAGLAAASLFPDTLRQIESEYRAQIEKVIAHGITPDHMDSEKHHHMIPGIFKIVLRLADEYKIRFVRLARELSGIPAGFAGQKPTVAQIAKTSVLDLLGRRAAGIKNTHDLDPGPDFWGIYHSGNMIVEAYEHFFSHFKGSLAEIMCHPGYETQEDNRALSEMGSWYLGGKREKELKALLDDKLKIAAGQAGIELVSFGEL